MSKPKASTTKPRPRTFAEPYRNPPPAPHGLVFPLSVLSPHRLITARTPLGPMFTHTPRNPCHSPRPVRAIPRSSAKSKPSRIDQDPPPRLYRESVGNKVWRKLKSVLRAAHVMKPYHVTVSEEIDAMERKMAGLPPLRIHKVSRTRRLYRTGKRTVLRGKGKVDRKVAQKRQVWRGKQRRRVNKRAEAAKKRAEKRVGEKAEKEGAINYVTKRKAIMTGRRDLRIPHDPEARRVREAALKALKPEPDTASLDTVETKTCLGIGASGCCCARPGAPQPHISNNTQFGFSRAKPKPRHPHRLNSPHLRESHTSITSSSKDDSKKAATILRRHTHWSPNIDLHRGRRSHFHLTHGLSYRHLLALGRGPGRRV